MSERAGDVVIVGAARTPFGKLLGGLSTLSAVQLGSRAIRGALAQAGVPGTNIDAVILGQVLQAGVGQNPAKQAALGAGISPAAHTSTVNKVCLSGLTAVIDSARLIRSGEARVVVAGGMESMTNAPHILPGARAGVKFGAIEAIDHMEYDGLRSAELGISMGLLTEQFAASFPVDRADQDRAAALSHQRARAATDEGIFAAEVVPVTINRKGEVTIAADEGIRDGVTTDSLRKLRPVFSSEGEITAGNSSPLSDGAAAVVLTTRAHAEEAGWQVLATLRAPGQVAGPDASLQAQPANALHAALIRQGWRITDLDHIEINEAFASVSVHSARALGVNPEVVNPHGGAIALGHPIGASGARLVVHAAHSIAAGAARRAGVALCGGGGQGEALLLEA
ncbi:acetyl-CoA C-acyltransferase [Corynebacterium liangguodongii]|uniref:Probable acetyl-CoA acetyltransferase n=1 Tax=Corynebacterium liangguodongii TaxID=2079535 RepID=A0A2S0WD57_9CORY|nr:acetyl-CoA C-acyltransferase [Corynebacterium liangguodongii]AWB83707.1 acetyl-CoA C-acyltransferase [Corynebacterium liangguodongii]PWB99483.1 acetyl-CoA C-acyltransferase [Corynebacterium liangguodongii]